MRWRTARAAAAPASAFASAPASALVLAFALALPVMGCTRGDPTPAAQPADLAVLNGKIITVDGADGNGAGRIAQAVAVRGGRFVAVGTDAEVRAYVGPSTRVIDARGRAVVPGLIDSHVHALDVAAAEVAQPFVNLSSIEAIQTWLRTQAARVPKGQWIWSPRIFPTRVKERRFPTREELDAAAPDHPVAIDGAYAWMVNTAALRAAGITRTTPDPPGGAIVKDAGGTPTGLLRNVGSMLARFRQAAEPQLAASPAAQPAASGATLDMLERVHRAYSRLGITSVIERGASLDGYRTYEALKRDGRLHVRAAVTIRIPKPQDPEATRQFVRDLPLKPGAGDEWLRTGALKIIADGGILAGTSFMRQPYGPASEALYGSGDPDYRGFLTITREQIASAIAIGHDHGWQMAAHVTGDAGVDAVLDAFAAAQARRPLPDRRHTLIHAYFANPESAMRAARLGVVVDTQPAWYYKDADALEAALGPERLAHFIGLRTWLQAGVHTTINTDHMFGLDGNTALNPFNPFLTMAVAVTRRTESGRVVSGDEAVTREQALRMMTIEAARLTHEEGHKGSIAPGKLGDLAILSDDLLTCPPDRIRAIVADVTIAGGRVLYARSPER